MRGIARVPPRYLIVVALAVLVLAVYWQVGRHAFVVLDDGEYVYENPIVLRGLTLDGARWAFTTFHAGNWHPLTWLSHMADVSLFGPDAGWHHRANALLHLLNTELLFLVLWRMTGGMWQSAFVAALFGVHPLHVESVAWVAERKDVLSGLFWILSMGAYLRYVWRPGAGRYLLVAASFALGLMSKPMLVTLPVVLLLLDWWPLRRVAVRDSGLAGAGGHPRRSWPALVKEKVPLLLMSAVSCVVTYLAQAKGTAVLQMNDLGFGPRVSNALVSYGVYLAKTVWPTSLAVFYPHPATIQAGVPVWRIAGSILLLAGLSFLSLRQAARRSYLAVGWMWFLVTLVPVIGIVQAGAQALADRYTYLPLIGVFIAIAWGVGESLPESRFRRPALGVVGGTAVLALSVAAWSQAGFWRNDVVLFSRAAAVTDDNWLALNTLGEGYRRLGRPQQAISCYREALRIKPDYVDAWTNLGVAYDALGQLQEAIANYREALRINPEYALAWTNLGVVYDTLGQPREAIAHYREALRIDPDFALAWNNLGVCYETLGSYRQAVDCYREALRIAPDFALAWSNLGAVHNKLGQFRQAMSCYGEALRFAPDSAAASNGLAAAKAGLGLAR